MSASLLAGGLLAALVLATSIGAPWLASHSPEQMDMEARLEGPSASHWLGTDNFGRDLWARIAHGSRISLTIALTSVAAGLLLGTPVGLLSGYFGGVVDRILMRVVDVFLAFPPFILALALVSVQGPGVSSVVVALTAIYWMEYARLVRAITLAESRRDYVEAARSLGATHANLMFRQILPRAFGPLAVLATLGVGTAIVAESGLSFLGFGVEPPAPTWGWTLAYGMRYLRSHMWLSMAPGLAIAVTVLGFNLFGDGLRDRLDPRQFVRTP